MGSAVPLIDSYIKRAAEARRVNSRAFAAALPQ